MALGTGIYWGALNQPQQERYQPYSYAPGEPDAARAALANQTGTSEYRQPCNKPQREDESDLCAQWKAARAAERGSLWTQIGVIVSTIGIMGLGATIFLTLRATEAAQRSALAAEKAVEGSERPHLLLEWCKIDLREPTFENQYPMTFCFRNHGKGPCWVRAWGVMTRTMEFDDPVDTPASVAKGTGNPWAVPPGATWHSSKPMDVVVRTDEAKRILAGEMRLMLFWTIHYSDADGRGHDHDFALTLIEPKTEPRLIPVDHPFWRYT